MLIGFGTSHCRRRIVLWTAVQCTLFVWFTASAEFTGSTSPETALAQKSLERISRLFRFTDRRPTSQPVLFLSDPENEAVFNTTLLVSKKTLEKRYGITPETSSSPLNLYSVTYLQKERQPEAWNESDFLINNHKPGSIRLKRPGSHGAPVRPTVSSHDSMRASNHTKGKGDGTPWKNYPLSTSYDQVWIKKQLTNSDKKTGPPVKDSELNTGFLKYHGLTKPPVIAINNHRNFGHSKMDRLKTSTPTIHAQPFTAVSISEKVHNSAIPDVMGEKMKYPDKVTSDTLTVLDAPNGVQTTIKHQKLIVVQKRMNSQIDITKKPSTGIKKIGDSKPSYNTAEKTKGTAHLVTENFSVAPIMDPWSNIPVPSKPSWASTVPPKGSSTSSQSTPSMFPGVSAMPFLASFLAPFLKRPLSPEVLSTSMQGIKAMQGFLRNSLIGAVVCFLPSALIAISLSATQRAELRNTPEMEEMLVFCKECLENLKSAADDSS